MKKSILKIVVAVVTFLMFNNVVNAGSMNVSVSSRSVTVGSTVVVTVSTSDLAGTFNITTSNSGVLSGGASNSWIEGRVTYVFTAKSAGSATIKVTPTDVTDFSTVKAYTTSKSVTITVKEPVNYSKNNYLKSLSVEGANINFSKDKTSYYVVMGKGTTSIKINGSVEDSKASVSGLGEKSVEEGDNNFEIKVTAEDGSTRTYSINVNVEESNPIDTKLGDEDYRVVKKEKLLDEKDGYERTTIQIDGMDIPALKSDKTKLVLIGLRDQDGDVHYAVYNDGKYELYREIKIGNLLLYSMTFSNKDIPSNTSKVEIAIDDEILEAYQLKDEKDLYLIYAMNLETGDTSVYQYDEKEKTIQRYITHSNIDENKLVEFLIKSSVIIIASIISFIAITIKMGIKNKETKV